MTNDEILQAAKDAGFKVAKYDSYVEIQPCVFGQNVNVEVARLIAIVEKRTIERCALAAIEACTSDLTDAEVIAAIRKLGEQK